MRFFNVDLRKIILVALIFALPLLSINMQRNPDELPWYLRATTFVASRIERAFMNFSSGVRSTTALYLNLIDVKRDNHELREQNSALQAQLLILDEIRRENLRLTELLNFKARNKMELVGAQVIGRDAMSEYDGILINRGANVGIMHGQGVITSDGVVGYVARADSSTASIRVMTDRYAVVDGVVQRTRARGIVEGKNRSTCRLRYIERAVDVAVGDLIVTTGIANLFPRGFPIGRVISVEETKYGVSQKVELEPVVHPSMLEEVFVILRSNGADFTPPAASPEAASTPAQPKDAAKAPEKKP